MSELTAVDVLRNFQKQCDFDGVEVQVSRQALDEVLDRHESLEAENAALREAQRWIPVTESPPMHELYEVVVDDTVYRGDIRIGVSWFDDRGWDEDCVTHWRKPIPPPPEEQK